MLNADSVDVVIPCYNGERFIGAAVDSVLNQSHKNILIFLIDDGSTDNTPAILREYGKRIRVLRHPNGRNRGAPTSMNLGLEESNSPFVAFLDADDTFYKKKIERQVEILSKREDVGLVYTNGHAIDESGRRIYPLFPDDFTEKEGSENLLLDNYIRTPSMVMVRRKLFKKTGYFDEKLSHSYDHDMWIKSKEVSSVFFLKEPLMGYRQHSGQRSEGREQWDDGFAVLRNACHRYPYTNKIRRKRLAVLHYRLGAYELNNKRIIKGLNHFMYAFLLDPVRSFSVATQLIIQENSR